MKKIIAFAALLLPGFAFAQINVGGTINDKANEKTGQVIDGVWNAPGKMKGKKGQKDQGAPADTTSKAGSNSSTSSTATTQTTTQIAPSVKTYQNYDFVAGTELVFADDFTADMDGEFPAHWELDYGQGVVNKVDGKQTFLITDGNYAKVHPRVTPNTYLSSDSWTIETDIYPVGGEYGLRFFFYVGETEQMAVQNDPAEVSASFPKSDGSEEYTSLLGSLTSEAHDTYFNRWHHIAIAYKNQQLKIYVDQNRVLVVPNCHCKPTSVVFGGIGSEEHPMKFTNVRIANGGNQNMLNALNTSGKIVSYGITFDVNKSDIKPESMGTLNEIAKLMKDNPALKLEIGGHCDSDGEDAANLKLSQARADAVRNQLISMGVDASRLTAKGFGETKPVAPNTSFEGKAKNRRVEFVKQ